jgi:hypothetical protein
MALANFVVTDRYSASNLQQVKEIEVTFTPDTSYPTGGSADFDSLVQAALDAQGAYMLPNGMQILNVVALRNVQGYGLEYDDTNDKLLVYVSGGTEVTATTDLSTGGDWTVLVRGVNR